MVQHDCPQVHDIASPTISVDGQVIALGSLEFVEAQICMDGRYGAHRWQSKGRGQVVPIAQSQP